MKKIIIATVASLGLISAAAASGTSTTTTTTGTSSGGTTVTTGGTTTGTVTIQPEVRTKVRQYITTSKPKSVAVPSGFTVRRGVALPETIEVQSLPSDVGVTEYRYVVVGDQTVLVNSNREIVEIIE
jgi:hypothetical protein